MFFFLIWIVGFTTAEGSFVIRKSGYQSFQLKHNIDINLFNTLKCVFNTKNKIYIEKELYNHFNVNFKADLQKIINFFSFSGLHPLVGLKNIQYLRWLESINNSIKYNNLNIPKNK